MSFQCIYCNFITEKRSNYIRHLSTNKHIINVKTKTSEGAQLSIIKHKKAQKSIKEHKNSKKVSLNDNINISSIKCKYCDKDFKNNRSLNYHHKNSCKIIPDKIRNNYIKSHNNNKKTKNKLELIETNKSNKIINNTMNNIVNNNLVVNPVGQESIDHIKKERMLEILSSGNDMLKEFCKELYGVNENLNVYIDFRCKLITFVNKENKLEIETMNRMIQKLVFTHMDRIKLIMKKYKNDLPDRVLTLFKETMMIYNCVISKDNMDDEEYIEKQHDMLNIRLMEDVKTSIMLIKDKCKVVLDNLKEDKISL